MRTVLGLSKTSTSIGWVLVDGADVSGDPLDHDAFDANDANVTAPAATARRVRDIATATGYTVDSVHVTTSGNVSSLRDALRDSGFAEVNFVPLTEATRAWAMSAGRENGQQTTGLCVLGRDSASLSVINTHSGAIESATTTKSLDGTGLADWLNASMGNNGSRPECLYLIGPRFGLDAIVGALEDGLSVPVVATHDAQLALARGAASSNVSCVDDSVVGRRSGFVSSARTLGVVAAIAVASLASLSSAGGPIHVAQSASRHAAIPSAPLPTEIPARDTPVAPLVFPPQPSVAAAPPVPEQPAPASMIPEPEPAETYAVPQEAIAAPAPQTTVADAPVEHLPEAQSMQHIPEAQPAAVPGPAAPPPVDPIQEALSPLFSGLP